MIMEETKLRKTDVPSKMNDADLLFSHTSLQRFWNLIQQGKGVKGWLVGDVVNMHTLVVEEMRRRKIKHRRISSVDDVTAEQMGATERQHSTQGLGDEVTLEEALQWFGGSTKVVAQVATLTGSIVNWRKTTKGLDVVINLPADTPSSITDPIESGIRRAIGDEKVQKRLNFVYGHNRPPLKGSVPLFDLALIPRAQEVQAMVGQLEVERVEEELKIVVANAKRLAETSKRKDEIIPLRFFYPLRTSVQAIKGCKEVEGYKVDALVELLKKYAQRLGVETEIPAAVVQRQFDGLRVQLHKKGEHVVVYSDDGCDVTSRFPSVVTQAKKWQPDYVVEGEVEAWVEGVHQPRECVRGYVQRRSSPDDSDLVLNVYNVLWLGGEDLHKEPEHKRLAMLRTSLEWGQTSAKVPPDPQHKLVFAETRVCVTIEELRSAVNHFAGQKGSEGAVVKLLEEDYPLSGSSVYVIEYKVLAEARAIVHRKVETRTPGMWNYDVAFSFSAQDLVDPRTIVQVGTKRYTHIARLYNTKTLLRSGDVVAVRYRTLNPYRDKETGGQRVVLCEAAFSEKVGGVPDLLSASIKAAGEGGILEEKEAQIPLETQKYYWFYDTQTQMIYEWEFLGFDEFMQLWG